MQGALPPLDDEAEEQFVEIDYERKFAVRRRGDKLFLAGAGGHGGKQSIFAPRGWR